MPPQKRKFSSKKIDDDKKAGLPTSRKKVVKKRRITTKVISKPTPKLFKKTMRKKTPLRKKKVVKEKKEIENFLDDIYENKKSSRNMNEIEMKKRHPIIKFFFTLILLGGFFAGIAWVGFFTFPGNKTFTEDSVKLTIEGPKYVNLGATTTYRINYGNLQKMDLDNVLLSIKYPNGFEIIEVLPEGKNSTNNEWDLDVLNPKETGYIEITGKMYGALKQEQSLRAFLNYSPKNFESELQTVATLTNKIDKTPFKLSVTGPDSVVVGNDVEYKFTLETTELILGQVIELVPQFPENFYITESEPELNQDKIWMVVDKTTTSTLEKQEFTIVGKYSEGEFDKLTAGVELQLYTNSDQTYSLAKSEINSLLSKNDLGFSLAINGSTKDFSSTPDELLTISLRIKNSSKEEFSDARIKLWLDAPALKRDSLLDWAEVSDDNDGDIQGIQLTDTHRRGQIIWNKRHVPALGEITSDDEVVIDLNIPIKNSNEINLSELQGHVINITSEISFKKDGKEKVISSNPINITINSDLTFENRDEVTTEDGKEVHNVTWILNNSLHPLENIKVSADVYGNIDSITTEDTIDGKLFYDEKNSKITWEIKQMPVEVDIFALPIKIKLSKKDLSQEILVSKVHIEATDTVTKETLSFMGEEVEL